MMLHLFTGYDVCTVHYLSVKKEHSFSDNAHCHRLAYVQSSRFWTLLANGHPVLQIMTKGILYNLKEGRARVCSLVTPV
jgi:hypothetical protein